MTYKLIETKSLASAQASIVFSSIPQTYTDLMLVFSMRGDVASTYVSTAIRFNSDSGSNYTNRLLYGEGSGGGFPALATTTQIQWVYSNGTTSTANTFGNAQVYIPNYTNSTSKVVLMDSVSENNATESIQALTYSYWNGTAAITTLSLTTQAGTNLLTGSTASLYGILKGSDGIVTTS
jgi:hypothetical protein